MRMRTLVKNDLREIERETNARGIKQEQIVNVFANPDGTFTIVYFEED